MSNQPTTDFQRHPWMNHVIWGWRVEIVLGLATVIALEVARSVSPIAPWALGIVLLALLRVNDSIRHRVLARLRVAQRERTLRAIFWRCAVIGRDGELPTVKSVTQSPTGWRYLLMLPVGLHLGSIEGRLDELAAALNARSLRVRPWSGGSRYVEFFVMMGDPFRVQVRSLLVDRDQDTLWEPISIGVGEDGRLVSITLPEHNLLIGGEPGSGKSVALSNIVAAAALDPRAHVTLLDGKEVELAVWRDIAEGFVGSSLTDALATLEGLRATMETRYRHLADSRRRKIAEDDIDGLHVLVIDELALYLRGGERVARDRFAELLRDLVARGRAAGIVVVAATQKPSHEIVPTWIRDLFSYRLAMRCTNPDASDTILGQGWASQGYNAATIDSAKRGVGLLLAEGGVPRLVRVPYLADDEIDQIAQRACRLRAS